MKLVILTVACGTLMSAQAHAQASVNAAPYPDLSREQARDRAHQLFEMFDVNHDGIITRKEAQPVGMRLLMERRATGRDTAPGIGGHTLTYLRHAFAQLQSVTELQFEQTFLAHFDEMDTNHDGILTDTERRQALVAQARK
jgi:Ca2+-binding EF-hand superfamily protein